MEVRYEIAKAMLRAGHKDEALKRIKELIDAHPNWVRFQRAKFQIDLHLENGREIPLSVLR